MRILFNMILLFNKESLATKLIILFKHDDTIHRKQSLAIKKKCVWNITSRNGSEEHQLPLVYFNMIKYGLAFRTNSYSSDNFFF